MSTNTLWESVMSQKYLLMVFDEHDALLNMVAGNTEDDLFGGVNIEEIGERYDLYETESGNRIGNGYLYSGNLADDISDVEMKI